MAEWKWGSRLKAVINLYFHVKLRDSEDQISLMDGPDWIDPVNRDRLQ